MNESPPRRQEGQEPQNRCAFFLGCPREERIREEERREEMRREERRRGGVKRGKRREERR